MIKNKYKSIESKGKDKGSEKLNIEKTLEETEEDEKELRIKPYFYIVQRLIDKYQKVVEYYSILDDSKYLQYLGKIKDLMDIDTIQDTQEAQKENEQVEDHQVEETNEEQNSNDMRISFERAFKEEYFDGGIQSPKEQNKYTEAKQMNSNQNHESSIEQQLPNTSTGK